MDKFLIEIEIYKKGEAQKEVLIRGIDDIYWTSSPWEASAIILDQIRKAQRALSRQKNQLGE